MDGRAYTATTRMHTSEGRALLGTAPVTRTGTVPGSNLIVIAGDAFGPIAWCLARERRLRGQFRALMPRPVRAVGLAAIPPAAIVVVADFLGKGRS
jgi:hypothetical protein